MAEAIKQQKPGTKIGFIGAHAAVLPTETLKASPSIDWVARKEFDFTCKEVAEGRALLEQSTAFPIAMPRAKSFTIANAD